MTAMDSGMHVVFLWLPEHVHPIVRHCFFTHFLAPPPAGYERYCPIPGEFASLALEAYALQAGDSGPEFSLPVHLDWERDGIPGSADVEVVFSFDAHVDGDKVCVEVSYRRITPSDVEGLGAFLSARGPARWWIPLAWLDQPQARIVPAAAATCCTYHRPSTNNTGRLAVGVEISGISGANATRFRQGFEMPYTDRRTSAVICSEVASRFLDLFVADILSREAAGEKVFGLDALGYDYEITGLQYDWRTMSEPSDFSGTIEFTAFGRINLLEDWHAMQISLHMGWNNSLPELLSGDDRCEFRDWRVAMSAEYPQDIGLTHASGLEADLNSIPYQRHHVISSDRCRAYSPCILLEPEEMGRRVIVGTDIIETPGEIRFVLGGYDVDPEQYDMDSASIDVQPTTLNIAFTRHFTDPFDACNPPSLWEDRGYRRGFFTISNTGSMPVSIELSTDHPDWISIESDVFTLAAGAEQRVAIEFMTGNHLSRVYDPEAPYEDYDAIVFIRHTACRSAPTIEVSVDTRVSYTHKPMVSRRRGEVEALCGWADIMMLRRGRNALVEQDRYRPDYAAGTELYVLSLSLQDPGDRYEFVAYSESGDVLAVESPHTSYKTFELPVSSDESLPLDARFRGDSSRSPNGPFHWIARGLRLQSIGTVEVSGVRAITPSRHGFVGVGPAGVTLVDTLDPRKPMVQVVFEDENETKLTDITSSKHTAYAVGDQRLVIIDLLSKSGPKIVNSREMPPGSAIIRHRGNRLWVAGKEQLILMQLEEASRLEILAKTELGSPALDIMPHKRGVIVLDRKGIQLFDLGEETGLTQVSKLPLDVEPGSTVVPRGLLAGVTHLKQGSRFVDFSNPTSPQVVATYTRPFWKFGMAIDLDRSITYTTNLPKDTIEVGLIRTRRMDK